MNNKDMEKLINGAVEKSTPDVWNSVLKNVEKGKGEFITTNEKPKKKKLLSTISGLAAALVLISVAVYGFTNYNRADLKVDSKIFIDVKPSVEISINVYSEVLSVVPNNEEGKAIIGTMDLKNCQLEVALNTLVDSMLKNGYLSDSSNSMLISVENKDTQKANLLMSDITEKISSIMKSEKFGGAAVVQTVETDAVLEKDAEDNEISLGKAKFINEIISKSEKENDVEYAFEDLAKLSVNELNLLSQKSWNENQSSENKNEITYSGKASESSYIGKEKVKQIALNAAGITEKDTKKLEAELDFENGFMIYEVEFEAKGREYDYYINAVNGDIIHSETEKDD